MVHAKSNSPLSSITLFAAIFVASRALIVNPNCVRGSEQSPESNEQTVLGENQDQQSNQDQRQQPDKLSRAPKDYPFSPKGSRVRNMIGFFESIDRSDYYDPSVREKQTVIISLSEAASKLHFLANGLPLETKCNKYVKLINQPNIRTFAAVNLLMNEDKLFEETQQTEANLIAMIQNERSFDGLSKIQTLLQSLESEKTNLRSNFEPSVQLDLLSCLNYYIYRHQRATFGLVDYVRHKNRNLELVSDSPKSSSLTLKKFNDLIEQIKQIEASEKEHKENDRASEWLDGLSKLQELVIKNHFEIPKSVQDFIRNPERLERLYSYNQTVAYGNHMKKLQCLALEAKLDQKSLQDNANYKRLLLQLYGAIDGDDSISAKNRKFVHEPNRWRLIESDVASLQARIEAKKTDENIATVADINDETETKQNKNDEDNISSQSPEVEQKKVESGVEPVLDEEHSSGNDDDFDYHLTDNSEEQEATATKVPGRDLCKELDSNLQDGIRAFNLEMDIEQARSLVISITSFKSECLVSSSNYSRWALYSLTKKISSWCTNKLKESNQKKLANADKAIMDILELLHGIQEKSNNDFVVDSRS